MNYEMHGDMLQAPNFIITEQPVKAVGPERLDMDVLEKQAQQARACLTAVDYRAARGTCIDERIRETLLGGGSVEPRPSVPGGPNVYGLALFELMGGFEKSDVPAENRLRHVTKLLNAGGIRSGGHAGCAANAGLPVWMRTIAENPGAVLGYAEEQMGDGYRPELADQVVGNAIRFMESGLYNDWTEGVLVRICGDEAAEAIEKLKDAPHEGYTFVRNRIDGTTVDQNELYDRSAVGRGSFVQDDPYADDIEHVLASGPDASTKKLLAEHAREMILAAVAGAVPNKLLYQITLN